jgi:phage baseplate assembly protein W
MGPIIDNEDNFQIDPTRGKVVNRSTNPGPGREEFKIEPLDFEKDISLGLTLPFINSNGRLFDKNYLSIDQAVSNVKNLILTVKGERVMHPNFGTNIRRFMFEPNYPNLREAVLSEIRDAIAFWLPYIIISDASTEIPKNPQEGTSYADINHGIIVHLTISLINNTIDEKEIVLEIKAD